MDIVSLILSALGLGQSIEAKISDRRTEAMKIANDVSTQLGIASQTLKWEALRVRQRWTASTPPGTPFPDIAGSKLDEMIAGYEIAVAAWAPEKLMKEFAEVPRGNLRQWDFIIQSLHAKKGAAEQMIHQQLGGIKAMDHALDNAMKAEQGFLS
ncbi:hypothetical protein HOY34_04505 [Xinfangfangia sp. D13-10-4-6]|uniref:hypothetical protein n=1 Tax=Pseudogemmobacter hezensis TaxID=2737662 RepID=UPI0015561901|nr:hypothetical protein [Pseudogemmobacter hezensis]NPD14460.1 hypothetical protein [Pseudogemmobacter hezensis]